MKANTWFPLFQGARQKLHLDWESQECTVRLLFLKIPSRGQMSAFLNSLAAVTEALLWPSMAERWRLPSPIQPPLVRWMLCLTQGTAENTVTQTSMLHLMGWAFQNQERQVEKTCSTVPTSTKCSVLKEEIALRGKHDLSVSPTPEQWPNVFTLGEQ